MTLFLDSFWRAVAYCLHPRVIALSVLPLVLMAAAAFGAGYLYWDAAVRGVAQWLETTGWVAGLVQWVGTMGFGNLRDVLAPAIVVVAATPLIVVVVLLAVALLMTPALVSLVAERRFPQLERRHGASFLRSALWSLGSMLLALLALVVSLPLWLIPPLILILPPLIWGWLTYRVMAFDALADHATGEERGKVFREHRAWLFGMGVATGYLGAAPSVVWASGWLFAAAFVVLIPFAIWIYTLVFAFSSLWFTHYCLAALEQVRRAAATAPQPVPAAVVDAAEPAATPGPPQPLALPHDRTAP